MQKVRIDTHGASGAASASDAVGRAGITMRRVKLIVCDWAEINAFVMENKFGTGLVGRVILSTDAIESLVAIRTLINTATIEEVRVNTGCALLAARACALTAALLGTFFAGS